ncbi:uroporphyrinogen decarboxylase family protein [Bacteroidota bacterium]
MDHKERFYATIERQKVDHPASWLGLPHAQAVPNLLRYFGSRDLDELRIKIDDDIYPIDIPYHSPVSDAVTMAFDFTGKGHLEWDDYTLNAPGFFKDISDPERVDDFDWPDPEKYIDPDECLQMVKKAPNDRIRMGSIWSAHFQDTFSAFGMENACIQMMMAPDMVHAVANRIVIFYLKANEIFFEATKGELEAVLIGNDFGGQKGLMVSPDTIREFAFPGTRKLVDQAKSYGLRVIHHSCGSIYEIIADLIEIGVDAIHPMQVGAANMESWRMKRDFGDKVAFVGGVDAQHTLANEGPEEVRNEVLKLKELFPTGLIISPSHEAVLPDVDPANVDALFKAVKE